MGSLPAPAAIPYRINQFSIIRVGSKPFLFKPGDCEMIFQVYHGYFFIIFSHFTQESITVYDYHDKIIYLNFKNL